MEQSRAAAPTLDWVAVPSHVADGPAEVRHKDGWLVCFVPADSYAKLIAAAPELLEALKAVEPFGDLRVSRELKSGLSKRERETFDEIIAKVRAAISKATS